MQVNPYIEPLLRNATDLANTPPSSAAELEQRWLRWGLIPSPRPVRDDDLEIATGFLTEWNRLVDAATEAARVELLNDMLRRYTAPPSITDHDGSGWHLHYRDPKAAFGNTLAGATTASAAQFLCARGMRRLGRCELPDCDTAFVDFSRPGKQRYCSPACANRGAVRRHRHHARTAAARSGVSAKPEGEGGAAMSCRFVQRDGRPARS